MRKKVLISAGGTGGHVYPAMALAKQLQDANIEVLFVAGGLNQNRYFDRNTYSFQDISCGTLSFSKPLQSFANVGRILKGFWQSTQILNKFAPDVVVGFGSYHTLPALLAAKCKTIKIILHEANRIPGRVNRLFSPYAELTGVHFADTAKLLKGKAIEIPIPLRDGYRKGVIPQDEARKMLGLRKNLLTLLVFGGSLGAQSINRLVSEAILGLSTSITDRFQVLHVAGNEQDAVHLEIAYRKSGIQACVKPYESRMDIAWQAANLIVSRSGAGTIAEAMEFEVPGILIPYPQAMDNHQESHADFMSEIVRGAIKMRESELNPEKLGKSIAEMLVDNPQRLTAMREAIHDYKQRSQARDLFSVICETIERGKYV